MTADVPPTHRPVTTTLLSHWRLRVQNSSFGNIYVPLPIRETLFNIPQPAQASDDQEIKDGLVVVPVTEDSKTLNALLRFCYPCTLADDPTFDVLEDVLNVLQSARKYSLDVIEKKAAHAFSNPKILTAEPLRCFALARSRRMPEETLLAAKYTLTQPFLPSWFKEINLITAADLLALLTYHRECGDAVYTLSADISWIKAHYRTSRGCVWFSGRSPKPKYKVFEGSSLQWWEDFMEETFVSLREKPCGETVASQAAKTVESVRGRNCPTCSARITKGMRDFSDLLTKMVEVVVSQIELDFSVPGSSKVHSESHPGTSGQGSSKKGKKRR
ncbi:hypothetical protein V8E55_005204 [Tylopilus felleus]